ncbi:hypothetical protein GLOTRDRAFT_140756 [Gloeophyllum trabeum ATCC 11539]|uniref:Sds3-like-domain-containing protein n=1 Tax=Gloeophyllum trabeum (strain ATCC 11539 / FP-39264 / Madison 617) TaxID=670483 RepID=S7PVU4_GLOTA|nr:uncharacterized protein GLOTRDRAFT_140756 [Gloeophyllum trabeum ATCC 11539]EPQ51751.1 hypothetical protein GLOTRDRAFT_140756 [Gloeophyllum trabeum ATCC 11539]
MPDSIASSEPLSSPSPSPPPPPPPPASRSHPAGAGLDSDGSELSELTDDEQDSEKRGSGAQDEGSRSPRRSGKKKRGSLVPAPMWDWAYKQRKGVDRGEMVEEEEEEDDDGGRREENYPRAMEEEEDEEDSPKGESAEDRQDSREMKRSGSPRNALDRSNSGPRSCSATPDSTSYFVRRASAGGGTDRRENDDGESEADVEDEHDSIKSSRPSSKENSPELTDDEQEDGDPNEEEEEEEDRRPSPRPHVASIRAEEEEEVESEDAASEDDADDAGQADDHDGAGDQERDDPPIPVKRPTPPIVNSMGPSEDVTAPDPATVVPLQEKAAASSIMAGSAVIEPPSPSSSSSPSSSRSASPEPGTQSRRQANRDSKKAGLDKDDQAGGTSGPLDAKGNDEDRDKDGGDGENEADVEVEAEGDEVDDHEMESDLQPAHRAEAMDVLAQIELKFALLREKLYLEKMEGLAWEEALIMDDNHPELLHLQAELSKRRDMRLDLAAKRRSYEVTMVTKKRKADEDGVWSWWKFSRDELQTDMISETNRKRRRLERARRASERPQPVRRIPDPPVNIPPAPTLRDIVKSTPFARHSYSPSSSNSQKRDNIHARPLVYPQLSSLSSAEVGNDLELIWQQRRRHADPRALNPPMGPPLSHGYEAGYGPMDGPHYNGSGPSRVAPPFPPHMQGYPGPSVPSRMQHHHAGPSGLHQSHLPMDQDMAMSSAVPPPSGPYTQHPATGMRRSLSPVHVTANGTSGLGPSQNGWFAGSSRGKPPGQHEWMKESRRPSGGKDDYGDRDREREKWERSEREREREWERERERMERERYQMQMMQSQPVRPSHGLHAGPGPLPHPGPPHNHHHHHHHIHHHHHPQSMGGPGGHSSSSLNNTPGPGAGSPRVSMLPREFDLGRPHSGPPTTEIINLSSSSTKRSPNTYWKGDELEPGRDRVRPPSNQHPLDDRPVQHIMTPVQLMTNHSGPHAHGPPSAPASIAPSPRGPWSAADDTGMRRPSSAAMGRPSNLSGRSSPGPMHGSVHGMRGPPPSSGSRQSPMVTSSPRNNKPPATTSPPMSSSNFPGPLRSPSRSSHALPPPPSSGPSSLPSMTAQPPLPHASSPVSRPSRVGSPPSLSKMIHSGGPSGPSPPLTGAPRPMSPLSRSANADPHSHSLGPSPSFNGTNRTTTPLSIYPGHAPPPSRTLGSDQSSPQLSNNAPPPKLNVVQLVDGA